MLDWATINPALRAWFIRATGLTLVVMENQPRPFIEECWGKLEVMSVQGHGMDDTDEIVEVDITVDPTVSRMYQRVQGQRSFVLRCSIESLNQEDGKMADNRLERLRSKWQLEAQRALLASANVCVSDFPNDSQMGDIEDDDHMISAWYVDVDFNAAFVYIDRPETSLDYFTSVEGYARLPSDSEPEQVLP